MKCEKEAKYSFWFTFAFTFWFSLFCSFNFVSHQHCCGVHLYQRNYEWKTQYSTKERVKDQTDQTNKSYFFSCILISFPIGELCFFFCARLIFASAVHTNIHTTDTLVNCQPNIHILFFLWFLQMKCRKSK